MAAFAAFATLTVSAAALILNGSRQAAAVCIAILLALLIWRIPHYRRTWIRWQTKTEAALIAAIIVAVAALVFLPIRPGRQEISFTNISEGASVHYFHLITGTGLPDEDEELWIYGTDPGRRIYALGRAVPEPGENGAWHACVPVGEKENGGKEFSFILVRVPAEIAKEAPTHKYLPELPHQLADKVERVVHVRRLNGATSNC